MMAETVTPNTFNPPHHELSQTIQHELDTLLQEYESQFAKDETSIGTTHISSTARLRLTPCTTTTTKLRIDR